jgi:hypothetical protein
MVDPFLSSRTIRLFVNIVAPPSFPVQTGFAVKIYIHGGFVPVVPSVEEAADIRVREVASSNSDPRTAWGARLNT